MDEAVKEVEKEFTISHFEDMNKLSDEQLQRRKELMDINFEKNRIQPGDKDYIYDKQVDFGQPEVESGWDNEDGNEDSDFWWTYLEHNFIEHVSIMLLCSQLPNHDPPHLILALHTRDKSRQSCTSFSRTYQLILHLIPLVKMYQMVCILDLSVMNPQVQSNLISVK